LNRLNAEAGDRLVSALTSRDVYQLLDGMSETPNWANFMLAVLRILFEMGGEARLSRRQSSDRH
jgi:hypothetical protein